MAWNISLFLSIWPGIQERPYKIIHSLLLPNIRSHTWSKFVSLMVVTVQVEMFLVVQPGHLSQEAAVSITRRGSPRVHGAIQGWQKSRIFHLSCVLLDNVKQQYSSFQLDRREGDWVLNTYSGVSEGCRCGIPWTKTEIEPFSTWTPAGAFVVGN